MSVEYRNAVGHGITWPEKIKNRKSRINYFENMYLEESEIDRSNSIE